MSTHPEVQPLAADPAQRPRIEEIRGNLLDRITEAEHEGWLGEVEGLKVHLAGAQQKLAQLDERTARASVHLGIPAYRDIAGRTVTATQPRRPAKERLVPDSTLPATLRACAHGIYTLEAAAGLIIDHAIWLDRADFARLIHTGPGSEATMAAIDCPAAATALSTGGLPCSAGERRMLTLAASLAGHAPVILSDAISGLDARSIQILVKAVLHANGQQQFP
jgi:hypothetical protein